MEVSSTTQVLTCCACDLLLAGQGRLFYKCRDCGLYRDVLTWSNLVVVRMPLIHVSRVLKEHFATTPPPSSYKIADKLGLSGTIGGPVHTLTTLLLKQEARCAHDFQKNCTVGGQICFFFKCMLLDTAMWFSNSQDKH